MAHNAVIALSVTVIAASLGFLTLECWLCLTSIPILKGPKVTQMVCHDNVHLNLEIFARLVPSEQVDLLQNHMHSQTARKKQALFSNSPVGGSMWNLFAKKPASGGILASLNRRARLPNRPFLPPPPKGKHASRPLSWESGWVSGPPNVLPKVGVFPLV